MTSPDAPPRPLETIRAELDGIDERIHELVVRRAALADEVRRAKTDTGAAALRPAREAQMLVRFAGLPCGEMRLEQIWRLWRELIMANARLQFPFTVDTVAGRDLGFWDLARAHFCFETEMAAHPDAGAALARTMEGSARVALLPTTDEGWWPDLAGSRGRAGVRVFAALPMISGEAGAAPQALAVSGVAIQPCGRDVTVLHVAGVGETASRRALAELGHDVIYWIGGRDGAIAGVPGLLAAATEAPAPLAGFPGATVLGAHAAPIVSAAGDAL